MTISPSPPAQTQADDSRFRTIFEQSPISTQIFSPDGRTLAVNRAWEELWGVTLDQIAGYNILQDEQLVERGIMPYILRGFAGEATDIPAIRYVPDQTIPDVSSVPFRWVRGSIYPVRNGDGTIREVVLMHEDITSQRSAEEALHASEERFRTMFNGAPVGLSLIDRDGRYVAVNPVRQEMLGYSEEELIGMHYLDVTHPDDVEYDQQINDEATARGQTHYQLEKRFLRKDGSVRWTRITVSMVRDTSGQPLYSVAIAEDITERKLIEEERARLLALERKSHARVERLAAEQAAILGQIAEGIIITDPEGRVTFVNDAARAIHGVAKTGVPIEQYSEVYNLLTMDGQPYPSGDLPLARAVLHGETVVDAEWRIRRPDGVEVVAQGSATPVTAEDGTQLGAVLTVRDVTAQHDLERQKDEFLSAAAHDLRTPLTTIKGRVQIMQQRMKRSMLEPERLEQDLARIDASTGRMIALINELLDVANIQIGRPLKLLRRSVDLVALARDVVAEHQQVTERHRITVEAAVPELVGVWDPARIERVLSNLLSNAIKYSPLGGDITVEVARDEREDSAVISVRDEGIGIPAADLHQIFERFHRAANTGGQIPGTGIGLAAVRAIVDQHGGMIAVESQEGAGATFTVRLPLHARLPLNEME